MTAAGLFGLATVLGGFGVAFTGGGPCVGLGGGTWLPSFPPAVGGPFAANKETQIIFHNQIFLWI